MTSRSTYSDALSAVRYAGALAIAASLGIISISRALRVEPVHDADLVGTIDYGLSKLRTALPGNARVGTPIWSDPDPVNGRDWILAQYALAPALTSKIDMQACLFGAPRPCEIAKVSHLALMGVDPSFANVLAKRMGMTVVARSGDYALLARSDP